MFRIKCSGRSRRRSLLVYSCAFASIRGLLPAADGQKVTYDDHVRPIFENKCFSCHNPDKAKGGLDLTTYGAAMAGGSSGAIVVAGQPGDSRIYTSITRTAEPEMPPEGDMLPEENIDLVAAWIAGGLLENAGSTAKKAKPSMSIALATPSTGKPEGPPPMPEHLVLEPEVITDRSYSPADIAASPWAPLVALAAPKQVLLFDTRNFRLAGVLPFPEGFPQNLAFSRNGQILVAGGGRGGKLGRAVGWDVKTGQRVFEIGNEFDSVLSADLSADHALVALGGPSRKVRIYSVQSGEELVMIKKHTDWVTALSFSPDGVLLASGDRNGNLFVWESGTGNLFYTLKGHDKAITAISWRADSNVVASGSEDGTVRLWEMNAGNQIKNWAAHGGGVLDLAYTGDGRIVSCGRDRFAKVWDGDGAQQAATNDFAEFPVTTCLTHDGAAFIVGDWTGAVKVFNSADGKPLGRLLANPPSIASRIAEADTKVAAREAEVAAAKAAVTVAAAALAAAQSALDSANTELAAREKEKNDAANILGGAKAKSDQAVAERDGAKAAHDAAAAALAKIAEAVKAASSDVAQVKQLEVELAQARVVLEEKQKVLAAGEAQLQAAQAAVVTAQAGLDAATAKIGGAAEAKKNAEAGLAAPAQAEGEAKARLAAAETTLAGAQSEKRFWQAADLNLQKHRKAQARPALVEQLEAAKTEVADAAKFAAEASAAAQSAADNLAKAEALVTKRAEAVEAIKAHLPDLEWELRLAKVVTNQKRAAVDGIRAAMAGAPETVLPKVEAAITESANSLAEAEARQSKIDDLLLHSVARAEAARAEAQAAVELAGKTLAEHRASEKAAAEALAAATKSGGEIETELGALEAQLAELQKSYLETLPAAL